MKIGITIVTKYLSKTQCHDARIKATIQSGFGRSVEIPYNHELVGFDNHLEAAKSACFRVGIKPIDITAGDADLGYTFIVTQWKEI